MHRMVDKPNLIADDALNEKIERMFNNTLFQRMVERADTMQEKEEETKDTELPLITTKAQEQFIRKVAQEAKRDEAPHFGGKLDPEIDLEPVETPVKEKRRDIVPVESGNESFGVNENACKTPITETKRGGEEKREEKKEEMLQVKEEKREERREEKREEKREEAKREEPRREIKKEAPIEKPEDIVDEYIDDDDMGFVIKEVDEEDFERMCKRLATKFGYPARSIKPDPTLKFKKNDDDDSEEESSESKNDSAIFDLAKIKKDKAKEQKKSEAKKEGKGNAEEGISKLESLIKKVDEN